MAHGAKMAAFAHGGGGCTQPCTCGGGWGTGALVVFSCFHRRIPRGDSDGLQRCGGGLAAPDAVACHGMRARGGSRRRPRCGCSSQHPPRLPPSPASPPNLSCSFRALHTVQSQEPGDIGSTHLLAREDGHVAVGAGLGRLAGHPLDQVVDVHQGEQVLAGGQVQGGVLVGLDGGPHVLQRIPAADAAQGAAVGAGCMGPVGWVGGGGVRACARTAGEGSGFRACSGAMAAGRGSSSRRSLAW